MLTDKEWEKLGGDSATVHSWELNGVTYHCQAKDTARGIVVKHLGRAVPLNAICSRKWLIPAILSFSSREPVLTKKPRDVERAAALCSAMISNPLSRVTLWNFIFKSLSE